MARSVLRLESLSDRLVPTAITAVGAMPGGDPTVTVFNLDGTEKFKVTPFGSDFRGGIRVAVGDVTGDGQADVIVAPGPGLSPRVQILDGNSGKVESSFLAFEETFLGGVYVSAGDLNQDGVADLVLTPDEGGGPRVRVLNGTDQTPFADFLGIDDRNFRGGARSAFGDVNGDGKLDLITAAGFGGGPRIAVFNGHSILNNQPTRVFGDFFAFEPGLRNGAFVTSGDINNDGYADLVFGGGPGGAPRVMVVSGQKLLQADTTTALSAPLANFFAGDTNDRTGVRVAIGSTTDGQRGLLTAGPGGVVSLYTLDGVASTGPGNGSKGSFVAASDVPLGRGSSQQIGLFGGGGSSTSTGGAGNSAVSSGGSVGNSGNASSIGIPNAGFYSVTNIINFDSNPSFYNNNLERVGGLQLLLLNDGRFSLSIPNTFNSPFGGTAVLANDGSLLLSGGFDSTFITSSTTFRFNAAIGIVNGQLLMNFRAASGINAAAVVNDTKFGLSNGNYYEALVVLA